MKAIYLLLSFLIVAFGQPAWVPGLALLVYLFGFALFFYTLLDIPRGKNRFWLAFAWFSSVQCVQLSWFLTHPFNYIFGLYFFLVFSMAAQFGWLAVYVTRERIASVWGILGLSGFWVLLEWARLYFLSGFSFNPVGIVLTDSIYSLQFASLFGVYGLTFFVISANLLLLRALMSTHKLRDLVVWAVYAVLPFAYGAAQLKVHERSFAKEGQNPDRVLTSLLVQTAFPIEEVMPFKNLDEFVQYTEQEWRQIFETIAPYKDQRVEMIALPEYVVPLGTYVAIYDYERVKALFEDVFGQSANQALPQLKEPMALEVDGKWQVTNAYLCQSIANLFQSDLVAGLQDDQWISDKERESYSSGFYFWPGGEVGFRYEKQVLLPMAEYIPLSYFKEMAKEYGITGSFTCGEGAKVFPGFKAPFGLSICYEETYGHLMKQNRERGAELLINLTSDVWYPNSRLPKQHLDHGRLRTVENGMPLLRACNTGITCAIDSLGRVIASLNEEQEWERAALKVELPLYHYKTLYTLWGDTAIVTLSLIFLFGLRRKF